MNVEGTNARGGAIDDHVMVACEVPESAEYDSDAAVTRQRRPVPTRNNIKKPHALRRTGSALTESTAVEAPQ